MHMRVCVCVVAADWSECGLCICICMCVLCKLIGEKVTHAYACVCVF